MKNLTDVQVEHNNSVNYLVELIGSFLLTFTGSWAIINKDLSPSKNLNLALVPALIIFVFLWFGSNKKFTSLNPAITFTLLITKKQEWAIGVVYIILQFTGAIIAAGFIFIELSPIQTNLIASNSVLGIPTPGSQSYDASILIGEIIGSFFLAYVYFAVFAGNKNDNEASIGALGVASVFFVCVLTLGEVYGAGLNPARSLAPAIMSGNINSNQLAQVVGPLIGCLLGGVLQSSIFVDDDEEDEEQQRILNESKLKLKRSINFQKEIELEEQ